MMARIIASLYAAVAVGIVAVPGEASQWVAVGPAVCAVGCIAIDRLGRDR